MFIVVSKLHSKVPMHRIHLKDVFKRGKYSLSVRKKENFDLSPMVIVDNIIVQEHEDIMNYDAKKVLTILGIDIF